ncbi:MAG: DUF302 domain-containing protein [Gemmatimonadetes bacterium]|nr:DUF302 domain-containing protein [Gemmatimonadota bacterium]
MSRTLDLPFEQAVARVREKLPGEGFGVLTEIDVTATLKAKLNQDFRRYVILGACNPPLAFRALSAERDIGVLLPCNVVVYAADEPGKTVVCAIDPESSLGRVGRPDLAPLAAEVKSRLTRVLAAL